MKSVYKLGLDLGEGMKVIEADTPEKLFKKARTLVEGRNKLLKTRQLIPDYEQKLKDAINGSLQLGESYV